MQPPDVAGSQPRDSCRARLRGFKAGGCAMTDTPKWAKIAAMSHCDRAAARREKERRVLGFLRREIWTTPRVLGVLLGQESTPAPRQAVHRFIQSLNRAGLVETEQLASHFVVGITADGQAVAADITSKDFVPREYDRGRVSLSTFQHREDLQLLHIRCARSGWSVFRYPDRRPVAEKTAAIHRPDAVTVAPCGQTVAVEVERTMKSRKRYAVIIGGHVSNIRSGRYQHVIYACPDRARARALQRIFHEIDRVVVSGKDVPLSDKERGMFSFLTFEEVPTWHQS